MSAAPPPVRIALLGTGAIAQVVHLPLLSRMQGVEVVSLHDADPVRARTIAERFGVGNVARTRDEVWSDPGVDAVVICTPNHLHEEHVRAGLAAGKYVLCEKPLALTSDGVRRILDEPGAEDRLLVAMNQRFRPDAAALRPLVAAGELGEVFFLKAGWLNRSAGHGRRSWRRRKQMAGGGAFMDLGVQMLDLALWMLGGPEPERVSAHMHREPGGEVEDSAVLMLRLAGERAINLEVTWNLRAERDRQFLHLLGTGGSASLAPLAVYKDAKGGQANVTPPLPSGRENLYTASYRVELEHFTETVRGERTSDLPREHLALMRVVEAVYRSAEEGREVAV